MRGFPNLMNKTFLLSSSSDLKPFRDDLGLFIQYVFHKTSRNVNCYSCLVNSMNKSEKLPE